MIGELLYKSLEMSISTDLRMIFARVDWPL
jgi:hypothetical protein